MKSIGKDNSPFLVENADSYRLWREQKLAHQPHSIEQQRVSILNPEKLDESEVAAITSRCSATNWALITIDNKNCMSQTTLKLLCQQLGLNRLDSNLKAEPSGISTVEVKQQTGTAYIPYTSRPLSWHTDGYYNPPDRQIRGMVLYCVRQAKIGGESLILDHELLYMKIRDADPSMIQALMQDDVLTIPANREAGHELRPDHTGPVFSVDENGNLHMRYSARTRNIIWKDDPCVEKATKFITGLFQSKDTPIIRYRMKPGEGIVSNNILHRREGFEDNHEPGLKRVFFRARYYDRIADTDVTTE